jgi:hypothetical protein
METLFQEQISALSAEGCFQFPRDIVSSLYAEVEHAGKSAVHNIEEFICKRYA